MHLVSKVENYGSKDLKLHSNTIRKRANSDLHEAVTKRGT